ncbi:MAG: hypothetical protein QXT77_07480 [Candidatus Methanomethylicaceae archaeon]
MLEAALHKDNAFITLTYSDEKLPKGGTLVPEHPQKFFKRLRKICEPARIRVFYVGEYGDRTRRPHYHAAVFGYPACSSLVRRNGRACGCPSCSGIARAWTDPADGVSFGFIQCGSLETASAAYVAAYATKSMTEQCRDLRYPDGCIPPFARASNRPGIGAGVCDDIASELLFAGADEVSSIPRYLSHGRIKWPLGRYLRNRIRERIGISKEEATAYTYGQLDAEMHDLREMALKAAPGTREATFKELLVSSHDQQRRQKKAKDAIRKQVKKL